MKRSSRKNLKKKSSKKRLAQQTDSSPNETATECTIIHSANPRIYAGISVFTIVLGILIHYNYGHFLHFLPLAYGYIVRMLGLGHLDLLHTPIVNTIRSTGVFKSRLTPSAPSQFAAFLGSMFSVSIIGLLAFEMVQEGYLAAIMLFCASGMSFVLDFCMGCKMFKIGMKIGLVPKSICQACAE